MMIPSSGVPNAKVALYGSGFQAGEEINLEIVSANMKFGTMNVHIGPEPAANKANASGAWSSDNWSRGSGYIPVDLNPGVYTLRATGNKGSVASTPMIVLEPKKK